MALSFTPATVVFFTATIAVALSGCSASVEFGDTTQRTEIDTFPADGITSIVVDTENGAVDVRGEDVDEIEIESIFDENESGDGDADITTTDGRITVTGTCDGDWFESCSVGFRIVVPTGTRVEVDSANGRIELMSLDGQIDASTDNGAIDAIDLRAADVRLHSDNGAIEVVFVEAPSTVEARSDNGAIDITVPTGETAYRVDAASDNGDVDTDVTTSPDADRTIVAHSDNGRVAVTSN